MGPKRLKVLFFKTPSLELKKIALTVYSYPNAAYHGIPMLANLNTYFYAFLTSVSSKSLNSVDFGTKKFAPKYGGLLLGAMKNSHYN